MSLVNLAHVCSHLTNASKGRLGLTSIPSSKLHLHLTLALLKAGFISTVVRGGAEPPPAHKLLSHPVPTSGQPEPGEHLIKAWEGYIIEPVTRENIASRRLWLGLKYWNNEPVLEKMSLISKPTRRIHMDTEGLSNLVRGKESGMVKGIRQPGECIFVSTDKGLMEARECVERRIGGQLLCRVY